MRLPRFTYLVPQNLTEILQLLHTHGKDCRILAGGTDLLVRMKQRLAKPAYLVSLKSLEALSYIREEDGNITIGSRTSLAEILKSPIIQERLPALIHAVESIGAPSIQHHRGSIGGNLCQENRCRFYNQSAFFRGTRDRCRKAGGSVCYAGSHKGCRSVCQSDCAPVLIAYDATVTLASQNGNRSIPLEELYTGVGISPRAVKPFELLTEIRVPLSQIDTSVSYQRLSCRSAIDYPLVSAAACLTVDGGNIVASRIVVGAMGCGPIVMSDALSGTRLKDRKAVEKVGADAAGLASQSAVENMFSSLEYRISMVPVIVGRAIYGALERG